MIEHIIFRFIKISNQFNTISIQCCVSNYGKLQKRKCIENQVLNSLQQRRCYRKHCHLFKKVKNRSPSYFFQLVPSSASRYLTINSNNISQNRKKHNFFKNCLTAKGIRLTRRLHLGLSHLREHKLKHSTQDYLNPLCLCGNDVETFTHFRVSHRC